MNPISEHERVVLVASRDNQPKGRALGHRFPQQFVPAVDPENGCRAGKIVIGQSGAIVKNTHTEIELARQRRNGLGNVGPSRQSRGRTVAQ